MGDNTSSKDGAAKSSTVGSTAKTGPQFFDAFDCSRRGLEYAGEVPLSRFTRLVADLPTQHSSVAWQVHGATGALGEALLRLHVQASPTVVCQRCLEPFDWTVDSQAELQLVGSEAELDTDDPVSDEELDDGYEKVLGSGHFDIFEQIEDELILALPYIARHPACSPEASAGADTPEPEPERRNPFAALGELRDQLKKD